MRVENLICLDWNPANLTNALDGNVFSLLPVYEPFDYEMLKGWIILCLKGFQFKEELFASEHLFE